MKKTKQCILCPYKKEEDCIFNHPKCYSLSNIFHGTILKIFPFKQLDRLFMKIGDLKENKRCEEMNRKYGNYTLEDDDCKFIWGVKSWDDLSGQDVNMYTMNDIDIIYDKKEKQYELGIETAYLFENHAMEYRYLKNCLNAFTKYMNDNDLNTNEHFMLFMHDTCCDVKADTIEELYTNFKIFVDGFCAQDEWNEEEKYAE